MNNDRLMNIVKSGNITIPLFIYKLLPELNIDCESFIFLMYLYNKGNNILFDIEKINSELSCDTKKIMEYISTLQDKGLMELKVVKNDKNIMEEYIDLDLFYKKIVFSIINEDKKEENNDEKNEIFTMLEKDVGLQLSFIEVETVKAWEEEYDREIIKEAIKEAIKNNVASIRYIDKILYNWLNKGIKTVKDLDNNRNGIKKKTEPKTKEEIFDVDWLDDEEE